VPAPVRSERQHRGRLLEGLAESIREKGLASTQITDIVRHASASRTTFYNCFEDKEACFAELAEVLSDAALAEVEAAVDTAAPWDRQVDQAIDAYLGMLVAEPAMTVTFSRELPTLGARGIAIMRRGIERYAEMLVRIFGSEGMRASGVADVTMDKAVMIIGGLNEMIVRTVDRGGSVQDLAPVAKEIVKAVLAESRGK
jgi:AcrR family transcriptional regulator